MIRLAISVEGQTEKEFFTRVIAPHLVHFNIFAIPIIVTTKRILDGPNHQGGDVSISRVVHEIRPLIHAFNFVTTFYDFYAFKGRQKQDTTSTICDSITSALDNPGNFLPYVQQYEFESLLFSDCRTIGKHFGSTDLANELLDAVQKKGEAEKVNDSYHTCPSRRIETACKTHANMHYDKVFHGPAIAEKIGLTRIRESCPLFSKWLQRLESL
jgi:hypothetical protein